MSQGILWPLAAGNGLLLTASGDLGPTTARNGMLPKPARFCTPVSLLVFLKRLFGLSASLFLCFCGARESAPGRCRRVWWGWVSLVAVCEWRWLCWSSNHQWVGFCCIHGSLCLLVFQWSHFYVIQCLLFCLETV